MHDAIAELAPAARVELYSLMRIGQGHLAAKKCNRGISDANVSDEAAIIGALMDDFDLHDHLEKGLYELERD